ncbi:MAG TPA: hypothetical protein VMW58_10995 [Anaerolineae bacterium]|nr:hypothetical protein [Anaerolineae bacterium]
MGLERSLAALLSLGLLILGLCVGCGEPPPLDTSLLTGEPCEPPCWQGLVPGVSTVREVEGVLAGSEYVKQDSVERERWGGSSTIWWESTASPPRGTERNAAVIKDSLLQTLVICPDYELAVDDIVGRYGTPEKLWASWAWPGGVEAAVTLYYPDEGLTVGLVLQPADGYHELDPGSKVTVVWYFAPTSLEGLINLGESIIFPPKEYVDTELVDWQGYGPIEVR